MKVKVLGVMTVDIPAEKTKNGRPFKATSIFALEDINSSYGEGQKFLGRYNKGSYTPVMIPDSVAPVGSIKVGSTYEIGVNLAGYVDSCKLI